MGKTNKRSIKTSFKKMTKMRRQGKLKYQRHAKKEVKPMGTPQVEYSDEEMESDHGEQMLSMVDREDLDFLKKAVTDGSYSMFHGRTFKQDRKALKRQSEADGDIETNYEANLEREEDGMELRHLLPIKTKSGLVKRAVREKIKDEKPEKKNNKKAKLEAEDQVGEKESDDEDVNDHYDVELEEADLSAPISMAEMLAKREHTIAQYKYKIGLLASAVLEDPQNKVLNIARILEIYNESRPEIQITLKKIVIVTLLEVFKDVLPSYHIKHHENAGVKMKKETRELQTSEKSLLKGYREYLTILEQIVSKLFKKGDTRVRSKPEIAMGELAMKCLCELLKTHPNFNYSQNIARLIIPYLGKSNETMRTEVFNCVKHIFTHDKKGEITLEIVRRINDMFKKSKHYYSEGILVLSSLNLSNVDLDKKKQAEIKEKKINEKKSRIINLSKKEKKRQKRIKEVEKELMETKAEENKEKLNTLLTETTKVVFTILFRILKNDPNSSLLSATLQGLAKFAHCINIEFYHDMVAVLDRLMTDGNLKVKEQLNCILTVFRILSGQGEALTVDPNRFYAHLYINMMNVALGKNENAELLIQSLDAVILGRRKKLTQSRLLSFAKRIGTICLHQEHHVVLALLSIFKQMLMFSKTVDVLLDVDTSIGEGFYLPELTDPEYCNAARTALYELTLLQRHYHPTVRRFAENLINGIPVTGKYSVEPEISKLTAVELFNKFDPKEMAFRPSVPPPKTKDVSTVKSSKITNPAFSSLCQRVLRIELKADFSILLDEKVNIKSEKI